MTELWKIPNELGISPFLAVLFGLACVVFFIYGLWFVIRMLWQLAKIVFLWVVVIPIVAMILIIGLTVLSYAIDHQLPLR